MRAFLALAVSELRLFFRERQAVFWTFLYPVVMLWLFGAIFGKYDVDGTSYSDAYVPSWIGTNILSVALYTIGTTLASYRERSVLKRVQATPVKPWTVLAAHGAFGVVIVLLSTAVLVAEGALFFHLNAPRLPAGVAAGLVLSVLALFPFGVLLAALAKNTRTSAALSAVVLNLMLLFSGATFPLAMFPAGLRDAAHALPLYFVIDLLRRAWNSPDWSGLATDACVLLCVCAAAALLAGRLFPWHADA